MEKQEIMTSVQNIFIDILENDDIILSNETTSDDIEEWDSLTHIQLIVAIEKGFKVRFNSQEIISWKNVGEMVDCIQTKLQ